MHPRHAATRSTLCFLTLGLSGLLLPLPSCQTAKPEATAAPKARPAPPASQDRPKRRIGRMDPSRVFYHPHFALDDEMSLGTLAGGEIRAATYLRYLAGRFGTRFVEDLAFETALERECARLRLARSAPVLARSMAAQRFHESGRKRTTDADGTLQRKFLNESLRQMRIDALCGLRRSEDPAVLQGLFDRRYGVGGARVRVRQILVSLAGTRRRLPGRPDDEQVWAAAQSRAEDLRAAIEAGSTFTSLLSKSDDRTTRAMLRRETQAAEAGVLAGYNYQRYGEAFAEAVRKLEVGQISPPIRSRAGYHVIELLARTETPKAEVEEALRTELRRGPAKPAEVARLRADLLHKYGFRPARAPTIR